MWKEPLKKVVELERSFGGELRSGATPEAANAFASKVKKRYGMILPAAYIEFLTYVDGYDFNGHCVFGTSKSADDDLSMVESNKFFHKNRNLKRYWFFGTSDISWYAFDRKVKRYIETDASEIVWEQYATFDELLTKIISDSLF